MELGDAVESALSAVGITKDRVSDWVGGECGCEERQRRLNSLGRWASAVLRGAVRDARGTISDLLSRE